MILNNRYEKQGHLLLLIFLLVVANIGFVTFFTKNVIYAANDFCYILIMA